MGDSQSGARSWRASAWSFGSLVKSLTSKSEEVLHAYQRDLEEFGIGLKKETVAAAEVTAHAVKELPLSFEGTAAVAQESLEAVGQSLEEFGSSVWRGTAELIGQVKEAVKKVDEESTEAPEAASSGRYSRYEAQLNALQCDSSTYCDEPGDEDDYNNWKSTFNLDDRKGEVESIMEDIAFIQELHARIVPSSVDDETFWMRYFYRLSKLQQAEDARADLVKRAHAVEEDLSWEVDEENDGDSKEQISVDKSAASSPKGHDESVVEYEARSDNSTSSDWLVVQEDKSASNPEPAQSSSQGDVTREPQSQDDAKTEKLKTTEVGGGGGSAEEDWGEWE